MTPIGAQVFSSEHCPANGTYEATCPSHGLTRIPFAQGWAMPLCGRGGCSEALVWTYIGEAPEDSGTALDAESGR